MEEYIIYVIVTSLTACLLYSFHYYIRGNYCKNKEENNNRQIHVEYSSSDSEDEYYTASHMYTTSERRQNRVITNVSVGYSESESSDDDNDCKLEIETKKIKTFSNINKYPIFCSICQKNVLNSVKVDCGHNYCKECITEYIKVNNNCPNCRNEIKNIYEIQVLIFK
jgi:hypothetical protein